MCKAKLPYFRRKYEEFLTMKEISIPLLETLICNLITTSKCYHYNIMFKNFVKSEALYIFHSETLYNYGLNEALYLKMHNV